MGLTSGADIANAGGKFYILRRDNTIRRVSNDVGSDLWQDAEGRRLALSLITSDHLGIDVLYVVDGLRQMVLKDVGLAGGESIDLWLCFAVVGAFAALGMALAYRAFRASVK